MDGTDGTSRDDDPVDWAQRFPADPELMTSPEGDEAGLADARRTARERRGADAGAAPDPSVRDDGLDVRPAHLDRPRPLDPPPVRPPPPPPPPVDPPRPVPPDVLPDDLRTGDPDLLVDTVRGSSVPREPETPARDDRPEGRAPRAADDD